MGFEMKIKDLFKVGDKTIFAGEVAAAEGVISNVQCYVEVDGVKIGELYIEGEVNTSGSHRDLWTKSPVNFTSNDLKSKDFRLVSRSEN